MIIPPINHLDSRTIAAHLTIRQNPPGFNPNDNQNGNGNPNARGLSKSILEYIFIAFVIFIVACIIFRRVLRRQRQSSNFSNMNPAHGYHGSFPADRSMELRFLDSNGQPYPAYPEPAAYMGNRRRTQATDIDSHGRRLGNPTGVTDHDGELNEKDRLPPYLPYGGPPNYIESMRQSGNPPPPPPPPLSGAVHSPDAGLQNNTSRNAPS